MIIQLNINFFKIKLFFRDIGVFGMEIIDGAVDTDDEEFLENYKHYLNLLDDYYRILDKIQLGGGEENVKRHTERGKLFVRERIEELLDPDTPFLELSPLAAHNMYGKDFVPAAGLITGIGLIHGREVMVVANDATVKGGVYFPMTVKKHLRAQEIALENNLPAS